MVLVGWIALFGSLGGSPSRGLVVDVLGKTGRAKVKIDDGEMQI
jgi:hypothetical protein